MADGGSYRPPPDRNRRTLVTPEGVALGLRLAAAGERAAAFLIDLSLIVGGLIALSFVAIAAAFAGGSEAGEFIAVLWLLGFFFFRSLYFIALEMGPRAATFGKRMIGIRVVARSGGRLTADSIIARNLVREIELFLPLGFLGYQASEGTGGGLTALAGFAWTGIFLFFPLFNRDRLRVGDLLAGTWVIAAPKRTLAEDLIAASPAPAAERRFSPDQLEAYGVFELQTLEEVLRSAHSDSIARVAAAIRRKIGEPADRDDEAFLSAYYEAARLHMERGLLLGRRREDKFDRSSAPDLLARRR